eukprot:scaffold1169_cov120-Cylindrotheca_fusiformis.AAC.41
MEEASSSSSWSSSSSEDSSIVNEVNDNSDSDENSNSSINKKDDDSSEDSSMSDDEESHSKQQEDDDEEEDDGDFEEEEKEQELTLQERVHRNEQKGLSFLQESRKRKSKAIEVAIQRLKNEKRSKRNDDGEKEEEEEVSSRKKKKKKSSKHAPAEVSSKRSDFFRRGAPKLNESGIGVEIGAHRYKPLDPRSSNLHGHFNEEQFEQNYEFLEGIRQKEIQQLKKQIKARNITGKRGQAKRRRLGITDKGSLEEDRERLKQLLQEKADLERRKLNRSAKQAVKKQMREKVEQGKGGAYFLKRKEKRQLELQAKMEVIRKKGGDAAVDKAVNKRRKKQKSKDAKIFVK